MEKILIFIITVIVFYFLRVLPDRRRDNKLNELQKKNSNLIDNKFELEILLFYFLQEFEYKIEDKIFKEIIEIYNEKRELMEHKIFCLYLENLNNDNKLSIQEVLQYLKIEEE